MSLLRWIISTLFAIGIVIFAVMNMQSVPLNYNPLDEALTLPLAVIIMVSLAAGTLFGGFFMWCIHGPLSRKADKKRGQVYDLIKENKELKAHQSAPSIRTPLLGSK